VPRSFARDGGGCDVVVAKATTSGARQDAGGHAETAAGSTRWEQYYARSPTAFASSWFTPSYESEEDEMEAALLETQDAIDLVSGTTRRWSWRPRTPSSRSSTARRALSTGSEASAVEPQRRVRILRSGVEALSADNADEEKASGSYVRCMLKSLLLGPSADRVAVRSWREYA